MNGSARSNLGSASSAKQLALIFLLFTLAARGVCAADAPHAAQQLWPFWDGQESIGHYAARVNLPPTKTLDLGGGVSMEFVLIPAGKFIMGTPEPVPVDEEFFRKKIIAGKAVLAAGVCVFLVLLGTVIIRMIRRKQRFQYSLRRFMAMMFALSVALLGGMHWWHWGKTLAQAQAEYKAALGRWKSSYGWVKPAHEVTLTRPFYMGKYAVTQEQWQQVMGSNPSYFVGENLPVDSVSWDDVQEFCKKVSGQTWQGVRLPTEAEWEYACRAGTVTTYNTGDREADLFRAAWYYANSKMTTHPVGQKKPNAWGLYDMHGNVWQWCQNWFGEYEAGAVVDPGGPLQGRFRVLRGGGWRQTAVSCGAASHVGYEPGNREAYFGFRCALDF